MIDNIHQTLTCLSQTIAKHLDFREKYSAARRIFNCPFNLWKCVQILIYFFSTDHTNVVFLSLKALGCKPMGLGMESGRISDRQISASSQYASSMAAIYGRLNFQQEGAGWAAIRNDPYPWFKVDLTNQDTIVVRIATQGRNHYNSHQFVTSYKLQSSNDNVNFRYYMEQGQTTDKVYINLHCKLVHKKRVHFCFFIFWSPQIFGR